MVFVGGQVTAAAAQKVTGLTKQLQGLLSVRVAHEEGARIRPRAWETDGGRGERGEREGGEHQQQPTGNSHPTEKYFWRFVYLKENVKY